MPQNKSCITQGFRLYTICGPRCSVEAVVVKFILFYCGNLLMIFMVSLYVKILIFSGILVMVSDCCAIVCFICPLKVLEGRQITQAMWVQCNDTFYRMLCKQVYFMSYLNFIYYYRMLCKQVYFMSYM